MFFGGKVFRSIFLSGVLFLVGCAAAPVSLSWLDVEWKRVYEITKSGVATYYYGENFDTLTISKSILIVQYYTNNKLVLKQTYPIVSIDERGRVVSYDVSTTTDIQIGVMYCSVSTNKMEVTNHVIYFTNRSSGAAATLDLMTELAVVGFTPK